MNSKAAAVNAMSSQVKNTIAALKQLLDICTEVLVTHESATLIVTGAESSNL
jgi:hypothetical protein